MCHGYSGVRAFASWAKHVQLVQLEAAAWHHLQMLCVLVDIMTRDVENFSFRPCLAKIVVVAASFEGGHNYHNPGQEGYICVALVALDYWYSNSVRDVLTRGGC